MAAAEGAGGGAAAAPPQPRIDDFSCPICLDLMYKPCANSCGHAFCFWCQHHAMSPFRPSKCPLCRSAYTHFPRVCLPLHRFLESAFPEQYAERERENKALEEKQGVESPDIPPAAAQGQAAAEAGASGLDVSPTYRCCRPECGRLACQPCVLSCGCVVCSPSCMPQAAQPRPRVSEGQQAAAGAAAAAADAAASDDQRTAAAGADQAEPGSGGKARPQVEGGAGAGPAPLAEAPAGAAAAEEEQPPAVVRPLGSRPATPPGQAQLPRCPGCKAAVLPNPQVCMKLEEALRCLYPHQYKEREAEVATERARREVEAAAAGTSSSCGGGGAEAGGVQDAAGGGRGGRVRPRSKLPRIDAMIEAAAAASAAADAAVAAAAANPDGPQPPPPPPPLSTLDIWSALRDELAANADTCFTWYSVGCDDCGVFPIVGRRYRCRDCPEAIGFDLCGACYDRGTAGRGRFNQAHRPGHRMRKVDPSFGSASRRRRQQQQRAAEGAAAQGAEAEEDGDGDSADPLGDDGIQVLTLMNYMEVLHPELTVEQATSLVLMHLGLAAGGAGGLTDMFDLGGAAAAGGGGGAGAGTGGQQQGQPAGVRVTARGGVLPQPQPAGGAGARAGGGGGGSSGGWSAVRSWFGSLGLRSNSAGGAAAGGGSGVAGGSGGGAARQAGFSNPTRGAASGGGGGTGQGSGNARGQQERGDGNSGCVVQ